MPVRKAVKSKNAARKEKACQTEVLNTDGKVTGKLDLPEKIFAAKINRDLMAQAVRVYLANQRQGTQSTKTRGEIVASTAKIWRQKGTGRARHGAKSAPIFVGGGVAHGPKPRDFSLKLPQKMRRAALFAALSAKFAEKGVIVAEGLEKIEAKTKAFAKVLENLKTNGKILLVLPGKLENLERAARNIKGVSLSEARSINAYLVLSHGKILFLRQSLPVLEKTFLKKELASDVVEKAKTTKKSVGAVKAKD